MIRIELRTARGLNNREHFAIRAARVKSERHAVGWCLKGKPKPTLPCSVILTRVAPSAGTDDDNLVGALKSVRDQVAEWLGVDDKDSLRVRYRYRQRRGPWGVEIEFGEAVSGWQAEIVSPWPSR